MSELSNAFAVLQLDVEGASNDEPKNSMESGPLIQSIQITTSEQCRMPLVWIDLEMTGLDVDKDRILEIACVITDGNLTKIFEGPDLVIHQSEECLGNMGEWCQIHHGASGLTKMVRQSKLSEQDAEKQMLKASVSFNMLDTGIFSCLWQLSVKINVLPDPYNAMSRIIQIIRFVKKHIDSSAVLPLLAGNSVYVDLLFLKKYMPNLASLFYHVLVDVSSVKALCMRWYPGDNKKAPSKVNKHRAMDDIKESIQELKFYKENIFKVKNKK
ncbi:hypothetical protein Syun_005852 [Stephania yunnanensis]|uniref:Exonuclease domain-containing protein n=1 Tax=Stephania yunnanensis TaxID=152371 RepID=A0AAP0KVV6_9MAGN